MLTASCKQFFSIIKSSKALDRGHAAQNRTDQGVDVTCYRLYSDFGGSSRGSGPSGAGVSVIIAGSLIWQVHTRADT